RHALKEAGEVWKDVLWQQFGAASCCAAKRCFAEQDHRDARERAPRLPRRTLGRSLETPGVLVCRLSRALLPRPLSLRLGRRVLSSPSVHPRRAGPCRASSRTAVYERRAAGLSRARTRQVPRG